MFALLLALGEPSLVAGVPRGGLTLRSLYDFWPDYGSTLVFEADRASGTLRLFRQLARQPLALDPSAIGSLLEGDARCCGRKERRNEEAVAALIAAYLGRAGPLSSRPQYLAQSALVRRRARSKARHTAPRSPLRMPWHRPGSHVSSAPPLPASRSCAQAAQLLRLVEQERAQLLAGREADGGGHVGFNHVLRVVQAALRIAFPAQK
eukprot:gene46525-56968_t